jgi:hypothetical protein
MRMFTLTFLLMSVTSESRGYMKYNVETEPEHIYIFYIKYYL